MSTIIDQAFADWPQMADFVRREYGSQRLDTAADYHREMRLAYDAGRHALQKVIDSEELMTMAEGRAKRCKPLSTKCRAYLEDAERHREELEKWQRELAQHKATYEAVEAEWILFGPSEQGGHWGCGDKARRSQAAARLTGKPAPIFDPLDEWTDLRCEVPA